MAINYGSNNITTTGKITSNAIDIVDGYNTLYFYSTDGDWSTATNWYLDYDHTIAAGRIPTINDITVILNELTSVTSGEIIAKEIIVRDLGHLNVGSGSVYKSDVKFFNSTYISAGQIVGNATFYDTSYLNYGGSGNSPVITGEAIFNNTSYFNNGGATYIGTKLIFNDDSHPFTSIGGSIYCPNTVINGTDTCANTYYGNVSVTSIFSLDIGSATNSVITDIYGGDFILYNNNRISGGIGLYAGVRIYDGGSVTLNDFSSIANGSVLEFWNDDKKCYLIFNNNTANSITTSNTTISGDRLDIIVNTKVPTYGSMIGGGGNDIHCDTLIFNGESFLYGYSGWVVQKMIFNNDSYINTSFDNAQSFAFPIIIFNDESYNDATISCDLAVFNDSSYNSGTIADTYGYGHASFNDLSSNNSGCTVNGQAVFKGWSKNYGDIDGDAWFDEFSSHNTGGYVYGSAYYLGPYAYAGGDDSSGYYQNWD
jgi:hypothetical protein